MKNRKSLFKILFCSVLVVLSVAPAAFAGENPLEVTTVREGLYVIGGLDVFVNVTFLVTNEGVLVVDAGNTTTEARWILEKIREKTEKPVKYVVLTHYHHDHTVGLMGFPKDAVIIAGTRCKQNFSTLLEKWLRDHVEKIIPDQIRMCNERIPILKKENNPEVKEWEEFLKKITRDLEDYKNGTLVYPGVTFDKKKDLLLGGEKIELIYPGPAHTAGNIVVHIPGKKTLVMGDMIFSGFHPYIDWNAGSDTENWVRWLEKLSQWDIQSVVPGHGAPGGKELVKKQARYLADMRKRVKEAIQKGRTLEQMKESITMADYKDLGYKGFVPNSMSAVYHELRKKAPSK